MTSIRKIELRGYQSLAVDALRGGFRDTHRQILVAPTAFGKTECAAYIILKAIEKGSRVWFIVDRVTLIEQTSKRFASYGIDHGVIQAKHSLTNLFKPVQIASAQTIARRSYTPSQLPDLIIWDECHCFYDSILKLIERCPRAKVIGLTATPFTAGMAEHWDGIVNGATVNQLLGHGGGERFLTPLKVKACVEPDWQGVKKRAGEYDEEEAGERGITIIGNVVQTWVQQTQRFFGGPAKTIVFSPSVKHGAELCRQFASAGFNFQQISYLDTDADARQAKIDEFSRPDSAIHGLVSCAVLTKGFDVPDVMVGISCRPYRKSFSSHIQELGRVMRRADGKEFGLWLCHSGNAVKFAEETAALYEYGVESLSDAEKKDAEPREPKEKTKAQMFCQECGTQMEVGNDACPDCGWQRPKRGEIHIVEGNLIDMEMSLRDSFKPRDRLYAACLSDPRRIWNAALAYCQTNTRKGEEAARKWALGVWCGIYPTSKLPHGLYSRTCDPNSVALDEWQLVEREVKRFRKGAAAQKKRAA